MGDECHNRNRAATSLLFRQLAPAIVKTTTNVETAEKVLRFIDSNDHFFLNLSMATAKASLDAARNIEGSTMVVVMARMALILVFRSPALEMSGLLEKLKYHQMHSIFPVLLKMMPTLISVIVL